jgi:hypothetical protein
MGTILLLKALQNLHGYQGALYAMTAGQKSSVCTPKAGC